MIGVLLGKVPFRARETTELCAPMLHALGFAMMALGLGLALLGLVRVRDDATSVTPLRDTGHIICRDVVNVRSGGPLYITTSRYLHSVHRPFMFRAFPRNHS